MKTLFAILIGTTVLCPQAQAGTAQIAKVPLTFLTRQALDAGTVRQMGCNYESSSPDVVAALFAVVQSLQETDYAPQVDPRVVISVSTDVAKTELLYGSAEWSGGKLGVRDGKAVVVKRSDLERIAALLKRMPLRSAGTKC